MTAVGTAPDVGADTVVTPRQVARAMSRTSIEVPSHAAGGWLAIPLREVLSMPEPLDRTLDPMRSRPEIQGWRCSVPPILRSPSQIPRKGGHHSCCAATGDPPSSTSTLRNVLGQGISPRAGEQRGHRAAPTAAGQAGFTSSGARGSGIRQAVIQEQREQGREPAASSNTGRATRVNGTRKKTGTAASAGAVAACGTGRREPSKGRENTPRKGR